MNLEIIKLRNSLSTICPRWAERLFDQSRRKSDSKESTFELPLPISLSWFRWRSKIVSQSECIVGEAHEFSPTYNCDECEKFSDNFSLYFYIHSPKEFEHTTSKFIEHWNRNHPSK